jgi:hypothetical protein
MFFISIVVVGGIGEGVRIERGEIKWKGGWVDWIGFKFSVRARKIREDRQMQLVLWWVKFYVEYGLEVKWTYAKKKI